MKLSKAVFWLTGVLAVLLLLSWLIRNVFLQQFLFYQLIIICLVNYGISLFYLYIHTYFYKTKPYAFGFIAMITVTIKFVLAYILLKLMGNLIHGQVFLKAAYFIVFAVFMIIDVLFAVLLLNSTKK